MSNFLTLLTFVLVYVAVSDYDLEAARPVDCGGAVVITCCVIVVVPGRRGIGLNTLVNELLTLFGSSLDVCRTCWSTAVTTVDYCKYF